MSLKYLFKQRLNYKKDEYLYYIYPNSHSSSFIRLSRKEGAILDEWKKRNGKHFITECYLILETEFTRVYKMWKERIEKKRSKFQLRPYQEQLILILKYIFNRNKSAKKVVKWSAKYKAYDDKQDFLELALNIAKMIRNDNFKYGWTEDPGTLGYEYVYFFQFGDKQVSFHSHILYDDIPEFQGKWNGIRHISFPFKLTEIKGQI